MGDIYVGGYYLMKVSDTSIPFAADIKYASFDISTWSYVNDTVVEL